MVHPFRGSVAVSSGRLTEAQLRTRAWRRLFRDVYIRADVEITHGVLCRAAVLGLPRDVVLSGASAAYLHGAEVLDTGAPVEVTAPRQIRKQSGIAVRRTPLAPDDRVEVQGLPATSLTRTAFDVARWREPTEAVVALDGLLRLGRLSLKDVARYAEERRSWCGSRKLADVLALAAPGAESPMESRLRILLVQAGLPTPVLQHRVYDSSGMFVARLDMAYLPQRLGIEYDGCHHFDPQAVRRDLFRQNALRALGWSLFRFTSEDVARRREHLAAQVRAALYRV